MTTDVLMNARSLLRQALCPECNRDGMVQVQGCGWCDERREFIAKLLAHPACEWCERGIPKSADGRRHESDDGTWACPAYSAVETGTARVLKHCRYGRCTGDRCTCDDIAGKHAYLMDEKQGLNRSGG